MFEFRTVPEVIVGESVSLQLPELIRARFDVSKVAVITDAALRATHLLDPILDAFNHAGIGVYVFDGVVADPPETVIKNAINRAREAAVDAVIGIGGGSSMDAAKLVAAFAASDQDLAHAYGIDKVTGPRLPLIQVPTTAGTGSEVTPIAIVTTGETTKLGVVSNRLYADLAVLDPTLTLGLPAMVSAATGIDAMVHAIEAYTSKIKKNAISDGLAREALRLLSGSLVQVCSNGRDIGARSNMLIGAMLAGQAFANAPVGAVHALAYPIGGIFHVPHGLSNALMLSPVIRFNLPAAAPLYAELAHVVMPQLTGSEEAKATAFIDFLGKLADQVGIARRLAQVGIQPSDVPMLAENAMLQQRLLVNNPREVTFGDALRLYSEAL
jgi:alcohol dehydrogenase